MLTNDWRKNRLNKVYGQLQKLGSIARTRHSGGDELRELISQPFHEFARHASTRVTVAALNVPADILHVVHVEQLLIFLTNLRIQASEVDAGSNRLHLIGILRCSEVVLMRQERCNCLTVYNQTEMDTCKLGMTMLSTMFFKVASSPNSLLCTLLQTVVRKRIAVAARRSVFAASPT